MQWRIQLPCNATWLLSICATSYTVENGYCDYHLMTFIPVENRYCDYFALVPNRSTWIMWLSAYDIPSCRKRILWLFCLGPGVVTISVLYWKSQNLKKTSAPRLRKLFPCPSTTTVRFLHSARPVIIAVSFCFRETRLAWMEEEGRGAGNVRQTDWVCNESESAERARKCLKISESA